MLNVLVACEESQAVCKAFRELGHNAFSCDIQECSGGHPEWHIQGDVLEVLNPKTTHEVGLCNQESDEFYGIVFETADGDWHAIPGKWDLIIAHPPCTYLSNVATRQFSLKCCTPEKVIWRWQERAKAAVFFMQFALADCNYIAVENPVGFMNSAYRKADQIIHPYFFAENVEDTENYHEKRTCLWLKGLPKLTQNSDLPKPPPMYICNSIQCAMLEYEYCSHGERKEATE